MPVRIHVLSPCQGRYQVLRRRPSFLSMGMRFTRLPRASRPSSRKHHRTTRASGRPQPKPQPTRLEPTPPSGIWWVVKPAASARTPRLLILVQPTMRWLHCHCHCLFSCKIEGGRVVDVSVAASKIGDVKWLARYLASGSKGAAFPGDCFLFYSLGGCFDARHRACLLGPQRCQHLVSLVCPWIQVVRTQNLAVPGFVRT
jgi:hypothetical protein